MEDAFGGADFGEVRVHSDSTSRQLNGKIQAKAFTSGSKIFFRDAVPDVGRPEGQRLMAHELTHVVQQSGGMDAGVRRTLTIAAAPDSVQREGDEGDEAPDLDSLRAESKAKLDEKVALGEQIKQAQLDLVSETDRNKKRRFQLKIKVLNQKLGQIQAQLQELFKTMGPLFAAEATAKAAAGAKDEEQRVALAKEAAEAQAAADKAAEDKAAADKAAADKAAADKAAEDKAAADKAAEDKAAADKAAEDQAKAEALAKEDAKYLTYGAVMALSMAKFVEYIDDTPKWDTRSTLSDADKDVIREIHTWAAAGDNVAPCAKFTISALLTQGKPLVEVFASLDAYVKVAGELRDPIQVDTMATVGHGVLVGDTINDLLSAFEPWVLAHALKATEFYALANDEDLRKNLIEYSKFTNPPTFQAENGADFRSYVKMYKGDGANPRFYQEQLDGWVRNVHRFSAEALELLRTNIADTSKVRPVTLILHSAIDHNGAFHRDPFMTKVFANPKINAVMLEGGDTLAAYSMWIPGVAADYGINGKLDQVMFAGHGGSRIIEMAGSVSEKPLSERKNATDTLQQDEENIDLDDNSADTLKFFDAILDNMDSSVVDPLAPSGPAQQVNRRILFNACLTNSNEVRQSLSKGSVDAKKEIIEYITDNASLATYMQTYAKSKNRDVTSLGANASITQVELIDDATGALDLKAPTDPKVTASKLIYTEFGLEPHGVLLAALEAWANDSTATVAAMQRRAAKTGSTGWADAVIETSFAQVLPWVGKMGLATKLQKQADLAHGFDEMKTPAKCRVPAMATFAKGDASARLVQFERIMKTDHYNTSSALQLVVMQVLAATEQEQVQFDAVTTVLGTNFDAKTGRDYVDTKYLKSANVLDKMLAGATSKGKLTLALMGLLDNKASAECKAYLVQARHAGAPLVAGLPEAPAVAAIPEQPAPRAKIPAEPLVKGRDKVEAIPNTKRTEVAAVADLPELQELAEVLAPPTPQAASTKAEVVPAPTPVIAPGRLGRPKRAAVDEVPAVLPFFPPALGLEAIAAGRITEAAVLKQLV